MREKMLSSAIRKVHNDNTTQLLEPKNCHKPTAKVGKSAEQTEPKWEHKMANGF